jgi:hypothetical protein
VAIGEPVSGSLVFGCTIATGFCRWHDATITIL